tara:strand:- start:2319 stop:2660 length:342 start_codon:yes stop_codon:yes gene_type:complete
MTFFDSDQVKRELDVIAELQQKVYENIVRFASMDDDEKIEHINLLDSLLEKQKILYTRLSLSDDPEARELKRQIVDSAIVMGMPKDTDIKVIFNNMSIMLTMMRKQIEEKKRL